MFNFVKVQFCILMYHSLCPWITQIYLNKFTYLNFSLRLIPQILNLITGLGSMNLYDNNNNSNSKYLLGASNIFEAILACDVIPSSQQHYKLGNTIVRATKETKTQRGSL